MTVKVADPLPECSLCDTPTLRAAWDANGGLCSRCRAGLADTVRMLMPQGVTHLESERVRRRPGPSEVVRLPLLSDLDLPADATRFLHARALPPVPPAVPRPEPEPDDECGCGGVHP